MRLNARISQDLPSGSLLCDRPVASKSRAASKTMTFRTRPTKWFNCVAVVCFACVLLSTTIQTAHFCGLKLPAAQVAVELDPASSSSPVCLTCLMAPSMSALHTPGRFLCRIQQQLVCWRFAEASQACPEFFPSVYSSPSQSPEPVSIRKSYFFGTKFFFIRGARYERRTWWGDRHFLSIASKAAAPKPALFNGTALRAPSRYFLAVAWTLLLLRLWVLARVPPRSLSIRPLIWRWPITTPLKATRTMILQNQAQEITANLEAQPNLRRRFAVLPLFTPHDFSVDELNLTQQFDLGISYLFERGHKRQRRLQAARTRPQLPAPRSPTPNVHWLSMLDRNSSAFCWPSPPCSSAQEDLKGFQSTVDIAEAQFNAGDISEADYLKIKLQLLQFQTDVSSARLAKAQALVALRQLLGYDAVPR